MIRGHCYSDTIMRQSHTAAVMKFKSLQLFVSEYAYRFDLVCAVYTPAVVAAAICALCMCSRGSVHECCYVLRQVT